MCYTESDFAERGERLMDELSDQQIRALLERDYPDVLKYCYAITECDEILAKDCCQETFLTFVKKQAEGALHFADPDRVKAWLFRTARHIARRQLRIAQRERHCLQYYGSTEEIADEPQLSYQPDLELDPRLTEREVLDRLYAHLKESEIQLFEQYFLRRIPCQDLADIYHVSENTLYQRVYRLRTRLETVMQQLFPQ